MSNQTIGGVPRELAERFAQYAESGKVSEPGMVEELRALLDAPAHVHEWDVNAEGTATVCHCGARSSDEPSA